MAATSCDRRVGGVTFIAFLFSGMIVVHGDLCQIGDSGTNVGRWVDDPTLAYPPCCGWDDNHWAHHRDVCSRMTKDGHNYEGQKTSSTQIGGHACTCTDVRRMAWVPERCQLVAWDARDFCRRLGDRTLLFIGDSTMGQATSTLASYIFLGRGGCQAQVKYAQSDTLIHELLGNFNRGKYWTRSVDDFKPDIVVVNAGPHVHRDFERVLTTVLQDYLKGPRDFTLVWKTENPAGCSKEAREITDWSNYTWANSTKKSYTQHKAQYKKRDALAKQILGPHVPVLDVRPLASRPDAHVGSNTGTNDCMHFCTPGPLSILPRLVLQMMILNYNLTRGPEPAASAAEPLRT